MDQDYDLRASCAHDGCGEQRAARLWLVQANGSAAVRCSTHLEPTMYRIHVIALAEWLRTRGEAVNAA